MNSGKPTPREKALQRANWTKLTSITKKWPTGCCITTLTSCFLLPVGLLTSVGWCAGSGYNTHDVVQWQFWMPQSYGGLLSAMLTLATFPPKINTRRPRKLPLLFSKCAWPEWCCAFFYTGADCHRSNCALVLWHFGRHAWYLRRCVTGMHPQEGLQSVLKFVCWDRWVLFQ